jgi:hypothetical protein
MEGKIYRLIDPITSKTHYVGQTIKDLSERLEGHIYESKKYIGTDQETAKHKWIVQLLDKDLSPKIELLEKVTKPGKRTLDTAEKFWIRSYLGESGQLLNLAFNPYRNKTIEIFNNLIFKLSTVNELEILYLDKQIDFTIIFDLYKEELNPLYDALTLFWKERVGNKHWISECVYYDILIKKLSIMLYIFGKGKKINYEKLENQYNKFANTKGMIYHRGPKKGDNLTVPTVDRLEKFFTHWVKMSPENLREQRTPHN